MKTLREMMDIVEAAQQPVAEGLANAGETLRSQIIKLYKKGLEDYDIAFDLGIDEKIVADIIDAYDKKQQQGMAEGYDDEEHPIRDDGNEGRPGRQRYPGKLKAKGMAEASEEAMANIDRLTRD